MQPIHITFLENQADGLRRLTTPNWSGACFVVSRSKLEAAVRTGKIDVPGVYILEGPSQIQKAHELPSLASTIYVGRSDNLGKRISKHHEKKEFWSSAFLFCRTPDHMDEGDMARIEARLIQRASEAGNHLQNVANPKIKDAVDEVADVFIDNVETFLKALGHDFLSPRKLVDVPIPNMKGSIEPNKLQPFRQMLEELKEFCNQLPSTEWYETRGDHRARVVSGNGRRVFLRVLTNKTSLRIIVGRREDGDVENISKSASNSLLARIRGAQHAAVIRLASDTA